MVENIFERLEIKYLLTLKQYEELRVRLDEYMQVDEYGLSKIQSIYYDTEDYGIIRNSLEKPIYKEKLRLRAYGDRVEDSSKVYLELKKKYDGTVYKRRIQLFYRDAIEYLNEGIYPATDSQILKEIDYFINFYRPVNRTYISYDRIAMYGKENPGLRITFDENIQALFDKSKFDSVGNGEKLLKDGERLMEIKVLGAMPLWLASTLADLKIYPSSFSKYGVAYKSICRDERNSYVRK